MGMFDQFQDKVALSESRTGAAAAVVTTSETGRCWNKSDPLFQHKSAATVFLREKRNMFKTIFLSFTHFCDRDTDALYWHEILFKKKNWSRSAGYLLFMITNFGEKVATAPIRSGHSHVRHLKTDINGIQSMKCTRVHLHHPFSLPYTGMHVHLVNAHFVTNISLQTAYREERK